MRESSNSQASDAPASSPEPPPGPRGDGEQTVDPGPVQNPRHVELILRQIDALPTLPAIAARLLTLTSNDQSEVREIVSLIQADPALSARVLALCNRAHLGVRREVVSIERAVVLLGFKAVRNAVLSVKIVEMFPEKPQPLRPDLEAESNFTRTAFWWHSLAVAVLAEMLAHAHRGDESMPADEAFTCGLLHDIGKLALDQILPKAFERVVELASLNRGNVADYERKVVGIDHHMVGKRLAQHWKLPTCLQDCIWLHGTPLHLLPRLPHRRLVGLVTLCDLLVRRQHIGYSGNYQFNDRVEDLVEALELKSDVVQDASTLLHQELIERADALGLSHQPSRDLFIQAVQRANQELGQLNTALERRGRDAAVQQRVLASISRFNTAQASDSSISETVAHVLDNASSLFGETAFAALCPDGGDQTWLLAERSATAGGVHETDILLDHKVAELVRRIDPRRPGQVSLGSIVEHVAEHLRCFEDADKIQVLPLGGAAGTVALLLHDQLALPEWEQFEPLVTTWGSAIAGAVYHDHSRQFGEELNDLNRELARMQEKLLETQSLARLGEMAAGAAHEMNNPLAVISGRCQILKSRLKPDTEAYHAAAIIVEQADRLSDLITSLHTLAAPSPPRRRPIALRPLVEHAVANLRKGLSAAMQRTPISMQFNQEANDQVVELDADQIQEALSELIRNALQASPRTGVHVASRIDVERDLIVIRVTDDGAGMDSRTLEHAKDPFFSNRPAGRRLGLGLARTQQFVAGHRGELTLHSTVGRGTHAVISIPLGNAAP